jgi:hypothetical protein
VRECLLHEYAYALSMASPAESLVDDAHDDGLHKEGHPAVDSQHHRGHDAVSCMFTPHHTTSCHIRFHSPHHITS